MNKTFEVQDWIGKLLFETNNLYDAEMIKDAMCDIEGEFDEQLAEDIYIVGRYENGEEFAPDFSYGDKGRC